MIEIFSIFYQIIFFLVFFSLSKNFFINKKTANNNLPEIILLNSVIISYILLLFSIINFSPSREIIFLIFLILLILIFFKRNSNFIKKNTDNYILFFLFSLIFSLEIAYYSNLEWDGLAHWFYKTKLFYYNVDIMQLSNLNFTHYPHLGPYLWSFFWKVSIIQKEYLGRIYLVFLYVSTLILVLNFFKLKNISFKIIILIFLYALSYDKFLFSGYMEYFLFVYTFLCSYILYRIILNNYIIDYYIFFSVSALLPWFKFEGLFIFILLNLSLLVFTNIRIKNKIFYFSALLVYVFLFYKIRDYIVDQKYIVETINFKNLINLFFLNQFFDRTFIITKGLVISFFKYPFYFLYFFSIIIFFFSKKKKYYKHLENFFYLTIFFFFGYLFLVYFIFLFLPEKDITNIVPVVIDRLLFQNLFFYVIPVVLVIKKLFRI